MKLNFSWIPMILIIGLILAACDAAGQESSSVRKIELRCGGRTVQIICGKVNDPDYSGDKRQCNHNALKFTEEDGRWYSPTPLKGFDFDKTPVSLSCDQGNGGKSYVSVEFNNGPRGCIQCLTYQLFEVDGKRISFDVTDRMPSYGRAVRELGIKYSNPIRIEGDGK